MDKPSTGPLVPTSRRRINLKRENRQELLQNRRIEGAAALFLDLEHGRSWAEIAQELGVSVSTLKDITQTPEFDEAYNSLFADIGHDPRYRAAQAAMNDMLPLAIRELKAMLIDANTSPSIRLKAIEMVLKMNSLTLEKPAASEKTELANFLVSNQVVVQNLPPQYQQALQELPSVVDAEAVEVE